MQALSIMRRVESCLIILRKLIVDSKDMLWEFCGEIDSFAASISRVRMMQARLEKSFRIASEKVRLLHIYIIAWVVRLILCSWFEAWHRIKMLQLSSTMRNWPISWLIQMSMSYFKNNFWMILKSWQIKRVVNL